MSNCFRPRQEQCRQTAIPTARHNSLNRSFWTVSREQDEFFESESGPELDFSQLFDVTSAFTTTLFERVHSINSN